MDATKKKHLKISFCSVFLIFFCLSSSWFILVSPVTFFSLVIHVEKGNVLTCLNFTLHFKSWVLPLDNSVLNFPLQRRDHVCYAKFQVPALSSPFSPHLLALPPASAVLFCSQSQLLAVADGRVTVGFLPKQRGAC